MIVRVIAIVATVCLALAAPAAAQVWSEFASRQDGFTANFPGMPAITETTYKSQFGADLPARVYSAALGSSKYVLTVVDYGPIEQILAAKAKGCPAGAETCLGGLGSTGPGYSWADRAGALIYAAWNFMRRPGVTVTAYDWNNIDQVVGVLMHLTNPDKSRAYAGIFMHRDRLYISEGTVPEGAPEPGLFQQSLGWIDENGNGIRYRTHYVNGQPVPPRER